MYQVIDSDPHGVTIHQDVRRLGRGGRKAGEVQQGNEVVRDQVPWSMPQLSMSLPTHVGLTTSATSSANSGAPGAGYSTANSSSGKP